MPPELYERTAELYTRCMARITVSAARESLSDVVDMARTEAVLLERYGRPAAVLLSLSE